MMPDEGKALVELAFMNGWLEGARGKRDMPTVQHEAKDQDEAYRIGWERGRNVYYIAVTQSVEYRLEVLRCKR